MPANEIIYSPKGELQWAKVLGEPRGFDGDMEKRSWSVNLLLEDTDPACQELIKKIKDKYVEEHGKKKPHQHGVPYKAHVDQEGNATGKMQFSFKRQEFTSRGDAKGAPIVVDSTGVQKWPEDKLIGNGSTGRVKFHIYPWGLGKPNPGLGMELRGLQVLELVEYETDDAGFSQEDGFVLSENDLKKEPEGEALLAEPCSIDTAACDFQSKVSEAVAELQADDDMPF